jgi:hypothetical protein
MRRSRCGIDLHQSVAGLFKGHLAAACAHRFDLHQYGFGSDAYDDLRQVRLRLAIFFHDIGSTQ